MRRRRRRRRRNAGVVPAPVVRIAPAFTRDVFKALVGLYLDQPVGNTAGAVARRFASDIGATVSTQAVATSLRELKDLGVVTDFFDPAVGGPAWTPTSFGLGINMTDLARMQAGVRMGERAPAQPTEQPTEQPTARPKGSYPGLRGFMRATPFDAERFIYLATLINPRDHHPIMVVGKPYGTSRGGLQIAAVRIGSPVDNPEDFVTVGAGYYGLEDEPTLSLSCARTHTPSGVSERGRGLGTMLYLGLSLGADYAHAAHEAAEHYGPGGTEYEAGSVPSRMHDRYERYDLEELYEGTEGRTGGCVGSSPHQRSEAASRWWNNAVNKYGIASEEYPDYEEPCEEGSDGEETTTLTLYGSAYYEPDHLADMIERETGWENVEVTSGYVEEECEVEVDVSYTGYDPDAAGNCPAAVIEADWTFRNGLVLHANPLLSWWHGLDDSWKLPPLDVLLGVDMTQVDSAGLFEYMVDLLAQQGATPKQIEDWIERNANAYVMEKSGYASFGSTFRQNPGRKKKGKRGPIRNAKKWKGFYGKLTKIE